MSIERFGGVRTTIAIEAARLMYEEGVKEYFTAKRLAAKHVLGRVEGKRARYRPATLPSNGEIRDALLALAEAIEGTGRTRKLFAMRVVALEMMQKLEPIEPRLIGSVSTGHVRRGSDIDISVFSDDPDPVERLIQSTGLPFVARPVTIFKFGEIREYLHYEIEERFPIELTMYARRELRFRPRSSTDGLPIVRLGIRAVAAMIEREHGEAWNRYRTDGALPSSSDDPDDEGALDDLDVDDDEEPCIPEPGEEEDPEQSYEPLTGFE